MDRHSKRYFFGNGKYTVTPTVTVTVSTVRLKLTRSKAVAIFGHAPLESLQYFKNVSSIVTSNVTHYSYFHIQRYF